MALALVVLASAWAGTAGAEEYPTNVVNAITFGGAAMDITTAVDTDADGNSYIVGWTLSDDYPQKGGLGIPYEGSEFGGQGFATKFTPDGDVVYSTYLPIRHTAEVSAAVGPDGSLYVVRTRGTPDPDNKDDLTVLKLNPAGDAIEYETDIAPMSSPAIDVDDQGRALVVASVLGPGFPVSPDARMTEPNPAHPTQPYGIVRLTPGGVVQHASYIEVSPYDVEVAGDSVYVAGSAEPHWFDHVPGPPFVDARQVDGAMAVLSPDLRTLERGTVAGVPGDLDYLTAIAVGNDGRVYATGHTVSGDADEIEPLDPEAGANESALYEEFSPAGKLRQLALMGGEEGYTIGMDVQIAPDGAVVVTGGTEAADFPAHGAPAGEEASAAFVFRVEGRQLTHSTAYVNEFVSTAVGVIPAAGGLVQVVGWGTPAPVIGGPHGPGEAFLTTLQLDPYVDAPQVSLRSGQQVRVDRHAVTLRAGADEDVDLRASASLKVRTEGGSRAVLLRSRKHHAEGYRKARIALKPVSRRSSRLLQAAIGKGQRLRTKVRVRFRDRGDAVARERVKVWLTPGR